MGILNRKAAVAAIAAALALGAASCSRPSSMPGADNSVPASASPWAACPHGDAGRVKDVTLRFPAQWVCAR